MFSLTPNSIKLMAVLVVACGARATADDFSSRDPFFVKLSTSATSVQDGKSFREALRAVAGQAKVNLWLDRKVDPTLPVYAGPVGPTVVAALEKIAATRDCVVMPVAGVVLVGRKSWVDATAVTLLSLDTKAPGGANANADRVATIAWPELTTPAAALKLAAGLDSIQLSPELPHDLWPAGRLAKIDRRVAVSLVLSQFDLRPRSTDSLGSLRCEQATDAGKVRRRYFAPEPKLVSAALGNVDRNARVQSRNGWIDATATVAAHRAATAAMLVAKPAPAVGGVAKKTFNLNTKASAGDLFATLAQAINRKVVIVPDAEPACEEIITIQAQQKTLVELIELVAAEANVAVAWQGDHIVIGLPEPKEELEPKDESAP